MAATLDSLATDASEPWDMLLKLTSTFQGDQMKFERPPLALYIERALAHALEDDDNHPGAVKLGVRFSSHLGDWPPEYDAVPDVEKAAWAAVAAEVTDALPRSHLLDLTLSAGISTGRDLGEQIARLYLELGAREVLDPYYRGSCLRRAWSVARQFSLSLENEIRTALYVMAQSLAGVSNAPVGVLFQPLEPLTVPPRDGSFTMPTRAEVAVLLRSARTRPEAGASHFESVAELRERLAQTDAERGAARRELIEGYFGLAEEAPGMIRVDWLQRAASKAQQYGLIELRDRAVNGLQAIPADELGMEAITTDIMLPRHAYDSRLNRYRWSRDARSALDIWLTSTSPTGSHEANLRQAKELSGRGILQLVTRTTFNSNGLPVRTTVGPEAAEWEALERTESMSAGIYGILLARELEAIKTEYGPVSAEDISAHLVGRFGCDAVLSTAIGQAIVSFWDGRHSDTGRAAFPLVEAGARGLLLALGEPLYRVQTGDTSGRFPALETYASKLEAHNFDPDWLRCLRNPVAGLRNVLAHGHRHSLLDHEAAVLLRMAALLVVLTPANASSEDRAQVASRLRDPIGWTGERARLERRRATVWVARRSARTQDPDDTSA